MTTKDRIINLPDIDFEGGIIENKAYLHDHDVTDWMLECAKVARENGLFDTEKFVEGMAIAILTSRNEAS